MAIVGGFMVPHPPMIVPAVGKGSEQQIAATTAAYTQVAEEIARLKPETIIISSPHAVMYRDYFHISPGSGATGSFTSFRAPEVRFREHYDEELVDVICRIAEEEQFPAGTEGERDPSLDHGVMVPLWFIRQYYQNFQIVRIGLSGLPLADHYALGQIIRRAVAETGRRVVFVASGDLSHKLQTYGPYGFAEEGLQYDARIMDVCGRGAFEELLDFEEDFLDRAAECGHRSFVIMAGAFDGVHVKATALSHEDVTGVGYGICTFYPESEADQENEIDPEREAEREQDPAVADPYVSLARASVESYVRDRQVLRLEELLSELPEEMLSRRAGAFVSIHEHGELRGCIGTIAPTTDSLAEEIIQNAISASTRDPRFYPIRPEELADLEISVDVLGEPEQISSMAELDVKRYGVIVSHGRKRGLLLPDLEGVDTVEYQVAIARQKAGIREGEPITLERFEVVRHE